MEVCEWLARAHHYRARIAEVDRRYATALSLYVTALGYQERCPEDLHSFAFAHLRMSEPLIATGQYAAAADHLNHSLRLFRLVSDQSSGRLQVELGFTSLSAAQGKIDEAEQIIRASREQARAMGFWRGELLCLGYLLALLIRARRLSGIPRVAFDILRTMRGGELGPGTMWPGSCPESPSWSA